MRIAFEWEYNFPNLKQKYREAVCYFTGHDWKTYKTEHSELSLMFYESMLFGLGKPVKKCARCGELKRKKVKQPAPKTIRFSRYGVSPKRKEKYGK